MCLVCGHIACFEKKAVTQSYTDTQGEANEEGDKDLFVVDVPFITVQQSGHIVDHYEETKHVYAQNIETQEVWDFNRVSIYKLNCLLLFPPKSTLTFNLCISFLQKDFINRLIMNQIDGKLVEVEGRSAEKES